MSIEFYEEEARVDRLSVPSPTLPPATTTNCWRIYSGSNKARIIGIITDLKIVKKKANDELTI